MTSMAVANGSEHALRPLILAELDRLLAKSPFVNAHRSSALLRFLVTETLDGRAEHLKEYVLGVEALGRPKNFDPRIDPIARVEASRLRSKLELCYADSTAEPPVRISLPKGTYVPEFSPQTARSQKEQSTGGRHVVSRAAWLGVAVLTGLILGLLLRTRPLQNEHLRVSILAPHDAEVQSVAISPDGKTVVMSAVTTGLSHLYLRQLAGSFHPKLLTETEGASFPFWSPDGRSIGFFAERKLKVLELNGAGPHVVAEAPLGRGGAWTPAGDIIFAPGALGPLVRISLKGGKAVPFTALNRADGDVSHLWPVLLPGGTRLGYLAQNRDPALDAVYAVDLAAPEKRTRVVNANSSIAFSRSVKNQLSVFFLSDGALLEQHVTESNLTRVGEPATLAAPVNFNPLDRYALFSSSLMNSVAFVSGTPFRFYLQWVNRNGADDGFIPGASDYYAFRISPDGSQLLTNRTDPRTGDTGVWTVDLGHGTISPITSRGVNFFPVWSPDGREVAYAEASGTAERGMRLNVVSKSGGRDRVLLDLKGPIFPSDWSGDGTLLAYTGYRPLAQVTVLSIRERTINEIWSYSPAGRSAGGGVFRPAGPHQSPKWIAYTSDESGRNEVYLQSLSADRLKIQISPSGGDRPLWRKDGQELYFVNSNAELCAVTVPENSAKFGTPRPLFKLIGSQQAVPPYTLDYAVSPDGQRFLVRREDPQTERSVINLVR